MKSGWYCYCRVPNARGKWAQTFVSGNLGILRKHGIFCAQIGNSLILKIRDIAISLIQNRDIAIFAAQFNFDPSLFCICNSHKSLILAQGRFVVGQGIPRFEWGPCIGVAWSKVTLSYRILLSDSLKIVDQQTDRTTLVVLTHFCQSI